MLFLLSLRFRDGRIQMGYSYMLKQLRRYPRESSRQDTLILFQCKDKCASIVNRKALAVQCFARYIRRKQTTIHNYSANVVNWSIIVLAHFQCHIFDSPVIKRRLRKKRRSAINTLESQKPSIQETSSYLCFVIDVNLTVDSSIVPCVRNKSTHKLFVPVHFFILTILPFCDC